jgi:hypothetical protein
MKRPLALFAVTASALVVAALAGAPAEAAPDRTPPTLVLPSHASFVVGSQISDTAGGPDRDSAYFPGTTLKQKIGWQATDASGICGYDVIAVLAGAEPFTLVEDTNATTYTDLTTDYDDQQGGGSFKVEGWNVVAHDCAGNTTTKFTNARPVVTQEDGWTYGFPGVTVTYSGVWGTSTCACWSGDKARKTTQAGAWVKLTRTWTAQETIGLVMEKAPNRGKVRIYVDGTLKATVDTHSATTVHRVIVWKWRFGAGTHVVKVVNVGTAGRPRIDLDAVLNS